MSLNADFIYNDDWHDVSNRVVSLRYASGPFSALHPEREDKCNIECQVGIKDYPISAIKLNKILQEEGVQYKDKKGGWALYAKYKDSSY